MNFAEPGTRQAGQTFRFSPPRGPAAPTRRPQVTAGAAWWPSATLSRAAAALMFAAAPLAAQAHVEARVPASLWRDWPLEGWVSVPLLLAALCYATGASRLRGRNSAPTRAARSSFYAGLATVFIALQTPLDAIAEHLFAVHQVQHLLMRGLAPMLLMLAVPAPALIAGLPDTVRRHVLAPLLRSAGVRGLFGFLGRPLVATLLYVASLYAWQVPAWHDAALLDGQLHDLMHVTMFASGMFFFWSVFDPQPAPWGAPFSRRIPMLGAAIFANIPIGALTTLKRSMWYPAYDQLGRAWHMAPMTDELLGGLVMWIAASMMGLFALLIVLRRWGRAEQRLEDRRLRGLPPEVAGAASDHRATGRRLGWGLASVPILVFACLLGFAVALRYRDLAPDLTLAASVPAAAGGHPVVVPPGAAAVK